MRALIAGLVTLAAVTSASAQDIGVPACDKMLKSYETCVMTKAAPQVQTQMKSAFDQMRTNWKAVAATPEGKKSLEPVCEQTTAQMKAQLASLNCTW
jgi:hypothetical protein